MLAPPITVANIENTAETGWTDVNTTEMCCLFSWDQLESEKEGEQTRPKFQDCLSLQYNSGTYEENLHTLSWTMNARREKRRRYLQPSPDVSTYPKVDLIFKTNKSKVLLQCVSQACSQQDPGLHDGCDRLSPETLGLPWAGIRHPAKHPTEAIKDTLTCLATLWLRLQNQEEDILENVQFWHSGSSWHRAPFHWGLP